MVDYCQLAQLKEFLRLFPFSPMIFQCAIKTHLSNSHWTRMCPFLVKERENLEFSSAHIYLFSVHSFFFFFFDVVNKRKDFPTTNSKNSLKKINCKYNLTDDFHSVFEENSKFKSNKMLRAHWLRICFMRAPTCTNQHQHDLICSTNMY